MDAESKDIIRFNQTLYHTSSYQNGLHELTLAVAGKNEQPSFPMWVIINKENEIVYRQNSLVKPKDLVGVLKTWFIELWILSNKLWAKSYELMSIEHWVFKIYADEWHK